MTLPMAHQKIANDWYFSARDIRETDMARSMYENGYVEVDTGNVSLLKGFVRRNFTIPVQESLLSQISGLKEVSDDK